MLNLYQTTVREGSFKALHKRAKTGDRIFLASLRSCENLWPHWRGIMAMFDQGGNGLEMLIEEEHRLVTPGRLYVPYGDTYALLRKNEKDEDEFVQPARVGAREGKDLMLYTQANKELKVKECLPHADGGFFVICNNNKNIAWIKFQGWIAGVLHNSVEEIVGHEFEDYAVCSDGIITRRGHEFFKNGQFLTKLEKWNQDWKWWPYGLSVATWANGILRTDAGKFIWGGNLDDANIGITSTGNKIVIREKWTFRIVHPEHNDSPETIRLPFPSNGSKDHWFGAIVEYKENPTDPKEATDYYLLVVK